MITAQSLELTYPETDYPALADVDLQLNAGEVLGVVGPMGAGKTTLCMSLAGLVPRTTGGESGGDLEVVDLDPRQAPVSEVAQRIGLVFEDYASQLTQITMLSEVMAPMLNHDVPVKQAEAEARRLLGELGLAGLDLEHKRTWELSGGQQQRVAIAAALAANPQVLILDNITGLLDPDGKEEIRSLVSQLSHRMTLVVVEQDIDLLVGVADQLLMLREGEVSALGPAGELLRDLAALDDAQVEPPVVVQVAQAAGLPDNPLTIEELTSAVQPPAALDPATAAGPESMEPAPGVQAPEPVDRPAESGTRPAEPGDRPKAVAIDGVSFAYKDGTTAVQDVALQVARGEVHAIVGGNGAGKSTLLRMLCGLVRPSSGTVVMDGQDTRECSPAELARSVGTALQNPDEQITERTVRQEIGDALHRRRKRRAGWFKREVVISDEQISDAVDRAVELVGLPPELMDQDPTHLSRGHRKLVAIAGALVLDPAVLILDEPRVSLDAPARAALRRLLHQLRDRGTAVVIVEHDLDLVAETADRVTLLDLGRVVASGSPHDVFGARGAEALAKTSLRPPRAAQVAAPFGVDAITVAELATQLYPVKQEV
ncbi:ABC transporter ATP-binding protein [Arthrobacter castelli]|uniref:ABC transporter ATP-binding protein n=1 Tax=Arthrobacter castelli TaxID=271431 RepID=UPI0004015F8C|nr:ATP-binding cassette domain-containing protein [Arthrobacter castelli]